jgi:hypothetical protein
LIEPRIDRKDRTADHAGETSERRPQSEHDGEKLRHADTDNPRHLRIVHPGTDHGTEPGTLQHQPERNSKDHRNDDDGETIERRGRGADPHEAAEARRRCDRNRIAAPPHQTEIGDHERNAEGDQHLRQLLAGKTTQQQALHQRAEYRNFEPGEDGANPKIDREAESTGKEGGAEIGAEHKHRAMRQIRNAHQPEDQRKAGGQQEQQAAERHAIDGQQNPERHRRRPCNSRKKPLRRSAERLPLSAQHLVSGG